MKKPALSQIFLGGGLLSTIFSIGLISWLTFYDMHLLISQFNGKASAASEEWLQEEFGGIRKAFLAKQSEVVSYFADELQHLSDSDLIQSLLWKNQYAAINSQLRQDVLEDDFVQLYISDATGRILAGYDKFEGVIEHTEYNLGNPSLTTQIQFTGDKAYRIIRHSIVNAFGDDLGILVAIMTLERENAMLNEFASRLALGLARFYQGQLIHVFNFPDVLDHSVQNGIHRYQDVAVDCEPMELPESPDFRFCVQKSIQLLTHLHESFDLISEQASDRIRKNIIFASLFVLLFIFAIIIILHNIVSVPLSGISQAFSRIGGKRKPDTGKFPVYLEEIDQLQTALKKTASLFDEREQLHRQLEQHAMQDALTGLPNRRFFEDRFQQALSQAQREKYEIVLLLIDLDKFKAVNDTLGHDSGDELLCQIASRLQKKVRSSDTLARWGGDEFVLLAPNLTMGDSDELVFKLMEAFAEPFHLKKHPTYHMDVSIGVASYPECGADMDALLAAADKAMYSAKEQLGTNRQTYQKIHDERLQRRSLLETELVHAISKKQLALHFQPIVDVVTMQISHAETLLRWHHPALGDISPAEFIPVAERIGIINELGRWVREEACVQLDGWEKRSYPALRLTLNVSPVELKKREFAEQFIQTLQQYGIKGEQVLLEITESVLISDLDLVAEHLDTLSRYNIHWGLDDFGTGFSALQHLTVLEPQMIKLDYSLVRVLETSERVQSLIQGTIQLAHSLDILVVCEGVETEWQYRFLKENFCDYIQGFWFARPVPAMEFIELLQENRKNIPAR